MNQYEQMYTIVYVPVKKKNQDIIAVQQNSGYLRIDLKKCAWIILDPHPLVFFNVVETNASLSSMISNTSDFPWTFHYQMVFFR